MARENTSAELAYERTAPFYDAFTAHHNYKLWLSRLLPAARSCGLRGTRVLDVACGTGKSFMPLLEDGWTVCGCDISKRMLDRARAKAGDRAQLQLLDMRRLPRLGQFNLIVCLDDAINYLGNRHELVQVFRGFERNLAPGGVALFDTNTLYSYRTFFASTEELTVEAGRLRWRGGATKSTPAGSTVEAVLEFLDEPELSPAVHRQRHFSADEVAAALSQAGLTAVDVHGHGLDAELEQPLEELRHTKAIHLAKATD